jgi:hypothetical protein
MPTLHRDDLGLPFAVSGEVLPVLLTHGFAAGAAMFAATTSCQNPASGPGLTLFRSIGSLSDLMERGGPSFDLLAS